MRHSTPSPRSLQGRVATFATGANPVINVSVYPFCAIPSKRERKGADSAGQKMPITRSVPLSASADWTASARKITGLAPRILLDG
ncbi:hypothetical protein [Stappia sp.]|uniref:hypothetical protein n=1 Tax=Stappia sp. TaxID=1870903 RepID=UPI0025D967F4|nr:hypothetical protein [Stappia sp.]|tara:strand:+ start:422 stop:676 length:255 start_codon:yes stop_codon:yes gene_type:complete